MKIVLIHGQNHKGSTYHIGRILADKLADEADMNEFFLPRDLNHFCLGCYACIEDEMKCPFYSDKKRILDAMEQADLFILTTPNYCMGPSAPMKSLIDLMYDNWMTHRPKAWMFKKKAVVISTAAGVGANKAVKMVKTSLENWGVPYVKGYGLAVQAMNWASVKKEKKAAIDRSMTALAAKLVRVGTPRVGLKTRFLFKMMAGMHSAGWDASPVEKQYWQEHGWLGKARPWRG